MPQLKPPGVPPRRLLGALRHSNYRLYFAGQVISTVGTWMQSVALSWYALELTHSGFKVGLVLAMQFTPMLVGGQFGGLLADRFAKRRILLVTQTLFILPAAWLFLVSETHTGQYWMVLLAALALGSINVFDVPCRQAFVIEMVGREDLLNAIALNSTIFNGAAVIGPSLAGLIIGLLGVPLCFLANAVSYLASIGALALMRNLPSLVGEGARVGQTAFGRILEGLAYARDNAVVGTLLLNVGVFSLFAMNRFTILPLFADQVLHVGPSGFGFMVAAQGLGAMVGALSLAFLQQRVATGRNQFLLGVSWSVFLVVFSSSRSLWLSVALLAAAGFCQITFVATANTRIQTATPDVLRGRVMALYAQSLMGVGPIGSLQAGTLAELFGAPWAMAAGALVSGLFLGASRLLRPGVFGASDKRRSV